MSRQKIEVRIVSDDEIQQWDQFIDLSETGTIFHKTAWLEAAAEETKTDLIRLMGFKGNNLCVALPIFVKRFMGFRFAFSPPPKCLIPSLGIVLSNDDKKQESKEKNYLEIIDNINEYIKKTIDPDYINIINTTGIVDMRAFLWKSYRITPMYTYYINLQKDKSKIFQNMNQKTRNLIRKAINYNNLKISNGDRDSYFRIIKHVRERYKDQSIILRPSDLYFGKLYDLLYQKKQIVIKEARNRDQYISGFVLLKYKNKIHHWIGGVVPKKKYSGINELIHWSIIEENIGGKIDFYDLVGANTPHLCRYKRKFGVTLEEYFKTEKGNFKGNLIKRIYSKLYK